MWNEEKEERIVLLTNHLFFGPTTIAAAYKDRWQIEIFFKTITQNLKIKTFVGTSPERSEDTDMDGADRHPSSEISQVPIELRLVPFKPGRHAALQSLHVQGLVGMDRQSL